MTLKSTLMTLKSTLKSSALLLEGGVTVSNNSTKRRQNDFKIDTRDKFATHLRYENFISNEIVIYTIFFFYDRRFSHPILYIHKLSHTPRILSLGSLWVRWPTTVTAKKLTSPQKEKPSGKKNNLTAKRVTTTSRQKK